MIACLSARPLAFTARSSGRRAKAAWSGDPFPRRDETYAALLPARVVRRGAVSGGDACEYRTRTTRPTRSTSQGRTRRQSRVKVCSRCESYRETHSLGEWPPSKGDRGAALCRPDGGSRLIASACERASSVKRGVSLRAIRKRPLRFGACSRIHGEAALSAKPGCRTGPAIPTTRQRKPRRCIQSAVEGGDAGRALATTGPWSSTRGSRRTLARRKRTGFCSSWGANRPPISATRVG